MFNGTPSSNSILPWALLLLGVIALIVLIINIIQTSRKKENGSDSIISLLASIVKGVFTHGAPSFVLFIGFAVTHPGAGVAQECVQGVQAVVDKQLPPLIDQSVAKRIPYSIPDLSGVPTTIGEILEQVNIEVQLTGDFVDGVNNILQELSKLSPYTYRATLRSVPSELDTGSPSSSE